MMHKDEALTNEFIDSWKWVKEFFHDLPSHFSYTPAVCQLMEQMQQKGYDRTIRAGQSLSDLILSRSKEHGLTEDQSRLTFSFGRNGMRVVAQFDGKEEMLSCEQIELTPQIDALLKRLEAQPIT